MNWETQAAYRGLAEWERSHGAEDTRGDFDGLLDDLADYVARNIAGLADDFNRDGAEEFERFCERLAEVDFADAEHRVKAAIRERFAAIRQTGEPASIPNVTGKAVRMAGKQR